MKKFMELGRADGKKLEITCDFSEGGINYFDGKRSKKGLYVHFSLVEVKEGFISRMLYDNSSFKILAIELNRRSARKLEALENEVLKHVEKLAELYKQDDRQAIYNLVTSLAN
jgi:hypothetical protein